MSLKLFFLLSSLTTASTAFSQKTPFNQGSFDFIYGQKLLKNTSIGNGDLNGFKNFQFGQPLSVVGVSYTSSFVTARRDNAPGHVYYTQVIPQPVVINDSTTSMITGFEFAVTGQAYDFLPEQKNIDLFASLAFAMGRLRLYDNAHTLLKNPYFSPKLLITPRFIFGRVSLIIYSGYEFDISNKNWKNTNGGKKAEQLDLFHTSMTGLTLMGGIGFTLPE